MAGQTISPQPVTILDGPIVSGGLLGSTIEEKTRRILGWTETYTPSYNVSHPGGGELSPGAGGRKAERKNSKSGAQGHPYPYNLLGAKSGGRSRKTSLSSAGGGESILKQQLTPPPSPAGSSSSFFNSTSHGLRSRAPISPDSSYGSLPTSPLSPHTPSPSTPSIPPPSFPAFTPAGPVSRTGVPLRHPLAPSLPPPGQDPSTTDGQVFDRLRELVPHIPTDRNAYQVLIKTVMSVIELEHELEALKQKTEGVRSILSRQNPRTSPSPTHPGSPSPDGVWEQTVPEDLAGIDVSAFKSLVSVPGTPSEKWTPPPTHLRSF